MKNIQVFDPALCCSSGVCGTDVDQKLVDFSADVDWVKQQGAQIERFNLAQQPMSFAENVPVKNLLQQGGEAALPVILLDEKVMLSGRYPTRAELAKWLDIAVAATISSEQAPEIVATGATGCCSSVSAEPAQSGNNCCGGSSSEPAKPAAKCC